MSKNPNQKVKILYILDLLMKTSSESHPVTTKDIVDMLSRNGILAERKSIYNDIDNLRLFGIDIILKRDQPPGYYIGKRDFELAELKLLVDAVQSSKFITRRKSQDLIKKIESLTSSDNAAKLQRQVYVSNRIKNMNESIYYNIDALHQAISENSEITFKYNSWTLEKKLEPRKNGVDYRVSPWQLVWDDENYYLIAYDEAADMLKYFRIDKMSKVAAIDEPRKGKHLMEHFDAGDFAKKTFNMFEGTERNVRLRVSNSLVGVMIDRFGTDPIFDNISDKSFEMSVKVCCSRQFFGWLSSFGPDVKILAPADIAEEYRNHLRSVIEAY